MTTETTTNDEQFNQLNMNSPLMPGIHLTNNLSIPALDNLELYKDPAAELFNQLNIKLGTSPANSLSISILDIIKLCRIIAEIFRAEKITTKEASLTLSAESINTAIQSECIHTAVREAIAITALRSVRNLCIPSVPDPLPEAINDIQTILGDPSVINDYSAVLSFSAEEDNATLYNSNDIAEAVLYRTIAEALLRGNELSDSIKTLERTFLHSSDRNLDSISITLLLPILGLNSKALEQQTHSSEGHTPQEDITVTGENSIVLEDTTEA